MDLLQSGSPRTGEGYLLTENGRHKTMHPAEQIAGFRSLAEEGKTPAQIGDLLGYGVKHVQRMLRLAGLAPVLLQALAEDKITTEHCQALALEDNPDRQVQVYEAACRQSWNNKPEVRVIRNLITDSRVSTLNNSKYAFVGEKAFSGDEIRADLFSDEQGCFVDKLALDTALLEKLQGGCGVPERGRRLGMGHRTPGRGQFSRRGQRGLSDSG